MIEYLIKMIQREIDRIAFNAQTQINVLKDSLAVPSSSGEGTRTRTY